MKTKDEIKEEIQLAEIGRDAYRAIRLSNNLRQSKIAADWESVFQRELDRLAASLAKVQKRNGT